MTFHHPTPRPADVVHERWLKTFGIHSFRGLSILDVGCGSGYLCHEAVKQGATRSVGIDICTPEYVSDAKTWEFLNVDLESVDWPERVGGTFDLILAFDIIEHLSNPYSFLTQCAKLMKSQESQLLLTTPNTLSLERFLRPDRWSGVQDPQHKILFTRYSLSFLLKRAGFSAISTRAPMRSLEIFGKIAPPCGGQILASARVN